MKKSHVPPSFLLLNFLESMQNSNEHVSGKMIGCVECQLSQIFLIEAFFPKKNTSLKLKNLFFRRKLLLVKNTTLW